MRTRVKICCISSVEEARLAIRMGADALGLVGHMPSGPGVISDDLIARISANVPPPVHTFLLTSETQVESIIAHHRKVRTNTIQIVDTLTKGTYDDLRQALPGVSLVQVVHVQDASALEQAHRCAPVVDALLLDSGNPRANTKILGGTGRTHDWQLSRQIVEAVDKPVFLAGGLHAGNVQQAMTEVQPFGLDLCSGVRTAGQLDPHKLEAFMRAVHTA